MQVKPSHRAKNTASIHLMYSTQTLSKPTASIDSTQTGITANIGPDRMVGRVELASSQPGSMLCLTSSQLDDC